MEAFEHLLDEGGGFVEAWCDGSDATELAIKQRTKATIRVVLEDRSAQGERCIHSGEPARRRALFARAY